MITRKEVLTAVAFFICGVPVFASQQDPKVLPVVTELPSVYDDPPLIFPGYIEAQEQYDHQKWFEDHLYVWPKSATVTLTCPDNGCVSKKTNR